MRTYLGPRMIRKTSPWLLLAIVMIVVLSLPVTPGLADGPRSAQKPAARALPEHYLLLVNTAIAFMMDEAKFRQFDKSPYDGLAVAFLHAYDVSEVPSVASMDARIKEWKKYTQKDIWPWVYLNRMIGFSAAENNSHADTPYFRKIAGADLDNANGSLADFLGIWRNSLAAARDSHAPGVVCDLEFYNYYKEYDIGELARQTGKTPAKAAEGLEQIGAQMARVAAEEYPDAVLWFLVTGFTHPGYKTYDGVAYYPSPTYVAKGLLDEIARKHLRVKVVTGGEGSLGYCHETLPEFRSAILKRHAEMETFIEKYKGIVEMAGTLTLWSDRSATGGWVNEGTCKTATARTVEELQPYLELMMNSYRYNWIYGSSDGNYLAFSPQNAPRFDAVIGRAKTRVHDGTLQ
ncbi:MAG: hypothetical protein LAN59_03030 [Acidobacteriia bacterium]|nr:hypothetical protein [Terriglobia bacterium]